MLCMLKYRQAAKPETEYLNSGWERMGASSTEREDPTQKRLLGRGGDEGAPERKKVLGIESRT